MNVEEKFRNVGSLHIETVKMFLEESKEFGKLDERDQLSVAWIVQKVPKSLRSWIGYLRDQYAKQSVPIDVKKMYNEIDQIMRDMKWI